MPESVQGKTWEELFNGLALPDRISREWGRMVYRPKVDERLCFVLMPFGQPFDSYYEKIVKPAAAETGLATLRSDEIHSRNAIVSDIWQHLWTARVVVADVSNRNPNVNYELGLCDALGVPTIIITGKIEDVPFDYKHRRCILYNRQEAGCDEKLRHDLIETIRAVLAETLGEDELKWPYDTSTLQEPAAGGVLLASADSRKIVIRGAELVRNAIASAFGPDGVSVAISQTFGSTVQLQRGSQIARGIKSSNLLEEKGIEQIRGATSAVYDSAGDCTKLAAILAAGFMKRGQDLIEKGFHPREVARSLDRSVEDVLACLGREIRQVGEAELLGVAATAANGDRRAAKLVVEAVKRAGKHGVVTIESTDQTETTLEVLEGVVFDRGYLSENFVTDAETLECVLENCVILLYQGRIQSLKDLLPLLEQIARSDRSLLIVADSVEGEALATLALNKMKGTLRCAAVKAPGDGDRRKALMEDIAVLTGGKFLSEEIGVPLVNVKLQDLGRAEKAILTQHDTTIAGAGGSVASVGERIRTVQTQIANCASAYDRERLQERLARLGGTVAVLKAGGLTEADLLREKYRLESAMHSVRSAIEGGAVAGGGSALLRASAALKATGTSSGLDSDVNVSVASVLEEPMRRLVENAGMSPTQILTEVFASGVQHSGFNAEDRKVGDVLKAGVLDPVRSIELCLKVALSHAASVLQTGTWDLSVPAAPPH